MKKVILAILFLSIIIPATAQTKAEKKKIKKEKAAEEYHVLKEFVNAKVFNFEARWATSSNGKRINMQSNPNYLKIDNNDAKIYLPFFGTAHSASVGFSSDGGIVFEGKINNYSVSLNDKKQRAIIKFSAKAKTEVFDFTLTLYPNKNADLMVLSNKRSNMNYSGIVE